MVYFDVKVSEWTKSEYNKKFILHPVSWPEGYQQVFDVEFNINAYDSDNDGYYDNYKINGGPVNTNHSIYKYKDGIVGNLPGGAQEHLYTFYARTVPTLKLRVLDENTQTHVSGVTFTMSRNSQSQTITSGLTDTMFYVQLHDEDAIPRRGHEVIDLRSNSSTGEWSVNCITVPDGYQSFNHFFLKILLENRNSHEKQLCIEYYSNGNTKIDCNNDYQNNQYIVTIHVKGGKKVNFYVYDGLDSVHTAQLPNATMKLCKQDGTEIATFTTDKDGKPTDTESFTKTLSEGDYTLKLASTAPDGYTQPADIPFTIKPGAGGLLTLTGDAAYVDTANSTVTMLVTKPNTKRIQLQVVDAITKEPWAGVNVKVTGKCLKATKDEERNYKIDSLAKNTHTLDLDLLDEGDITVTIVGSDNKNEIEKKYHDGSYINNFVGSKFVFNLQKNTDDTVTLTAKNFNGSISTDGSTVLVYAYPKVNFDFKCNSPVLPEYAVGKGTLTVVTNPDKKSVITADTEKIAGHDTITPWEMNSRNRNHSEGVPIGNYTLVNDEEHGWVLFEPDPKTTPWNFSVERDNSSGFPVVKDKDGNILTDKTIVAWYNLLKTS